MDFFDWLDNVRGVWWGQLLNAVVFTLFLTFIFSVGFFIWAIFL